MAEKAELEALDLAALLCSRVCHDIISPVGAITNGLEVMDEEESEEMKAFAFDLIRKSARQASAKLQFARLAFGAAGSAGASIDLADAEKVAAGYMAGEKAELQWEAPRALMPKNKVKLLLNLVLLSVTAVPRGGLVSVVVSGEEDATRFDIRCTGPNARVPPSFEGLVRGEVGEEPIDAHAVQPYYTGLLARSCGMDVGARLDGEAVLITAARAA